MRRLYLQFLLGLCALGPALAGSAPTALEALKLLPKSASGQLAIVEAFEGQPMPDRWHILLYDPKEENGVHEYVVAYGEVIASRSVSQFAETLTPEQVLGAGVVKIDSDRAGKMAVEFAQASSLNVATYNYELKKQGAEAVPLWRITCLGLKGEVLGTLVLTATKGAVVSHDGFDVEPPMIAEKAEKHEKPERSEHTERTKPPREEVAEARRAAPDRDEALDAPPPEPPRDDHPGLLRRATGSLQRIFTGRE